MDLCLDFVLLTYLDVVKKVDDFKLLVTIRSNHQLIPSMVF